MGRANGWLGRQTSRNCCIGSPGGQFGESQWCPWRWQWFQHLAVELPFRGNELWGILGAKWVHLERGYWGWHQSWPKWAETVNCGLQIKHFQTLITYLQVSFGDLNLVWQTMQKLDHRSTIGVGTHIQEMKDFILCLSLILSLFFQLKAIFQKLIKVFEVM